MKLHPSVKRWLGWAFLLLLWSLTLWGVDATWKKRSKERERPYRELGKVIATVIHQVLTDPYFLPLEKLSHHLTLHPQLTHLTVDLLAKWAPDNEFPTCFVWNTDGSLLQLDHSLPPPVAEALVNELKSSLGGRIGQHTLFISLFNADGQRWWLGFLPVPLRSPFPTQMAGALFSLEDYLNHYVPRLLKDMAERPRFPLVEFEPNDPHSTRQGTFSFRILREDGSVFYQQGKNFDPNHLIYSESRHQSAPVIVAMQRGWDLEIYRSPGANEAGLPRSFFSWLLWGVGILFLSLSWWISKR